MKKYCKYCGLEIVYVELFEHDSGRPIDDVAWIGAGTRSVVCFKADWHAPFDTPVSLEREPLERWLAEPVVID